MFGALGFGGFGFRSVNAQGFSRIWVVVFEIRGMLLPLEAARK